MVETENNGKEELCDCIEQAEAILDEADALEDEAESILEEMDTMREEVLSALSQVKQLILEMKIAKAKLETLEPCGPDCEILTGLAINIPEDTELEQMVGEIVENIPPAKAAYDIFLAQKHEMEIAKDGLDKRLDKQHHAQANC